MVVARYFVGFTMPLVFCAAQLTAQTARDTAAVAPRTSTATLATAGIAAGAFGLIGGIKLGESIERSSYSCNCDDPGLLGAIIGAFIGPAIAAPLGVHLANQQPRNFGTALSKSLFIGGAGLLVAIASGGTGIIVVPVLPILETITAIRAERR